MAIHKSPGSYNVPFDRGNVFDRALIRGDTVRALITPSALAGAWEDELALLCDIASFEFLNLSFLDADPALNTRLAGAGALLGRVVEEGDYLVYREPGRTVLLTSAEMAASFGRGDTTSPLRWIDSTFERDTYGEWDFVVAGRDSIDQSEWQAGYHRLCDTVTFCRQLRLIQIARGEFETHPRFRINKGLYYAYQRYVVFPGLGHLRFPSRPSARTMGGRTESLGQRLEFICWAFDRIGIAAHCIQHNDTADDAFYHLGYLVMLAAGVHDDIAAICNDTYRLGLYRTQVSLRRNERGTSTFLTSLARHSALMHGWLQSDHAVAACSLIYPLRDALQHREFPTQFGSSRPDSPNRLAVPPECVSAMELFGLPTAAVQRRQTFQGLGTLIPYLSLATAIIRSIQYLVNSLLVVVGTDLISSRVPSRTQTVLVDRWASGPSQLLQIGGAPLLL